MLGTFWSGIDSSLGHMAPKLQRLRNCLLTQSFMLTLARRPGLRLTRQSTVIYGCHGP